MNSKYQTRVFDEAGVSAGNCRGKSALSASTAIARLAGLAIFGMAVGTTAQAQSLPTGGSVSSGQATVSASPNTLTVNQTSQNVAVNWQTFSIGQDKAVVFVQPNSNSVALNRVLGADPSVILGSLTANGKVFLVNPNGILFGKGANVNVGGLVASTLGISDADFMAGRYAFSGNGGAVLNQGSINADGGYVALLGASVSNQGLIQANLGTVALAAGEAVTLDVAGDGLLNVAINKGAVNALVENGGVLRADGGRVMMTAQAAGALLRTVVNNSGIIEARTLENRNGTIMLLGDMQSGTMNVGGVFDASAAQGGDGGFIETSAATVNVADGVKVTTAAPFGKTGTWLIDPQDFTLPRSAATSPARHFRSASDQQRRSSARFPPQETIQEAPATSTSTTPSPGQRPERRPRLTLNAVRDVNINAAITATNGNLVACCGPRRERQCAITTKNGSVLLNAART
jgi:filamentous hemagglutinin family protein